MRIRLAPATDIALQIDALGPFYERTDRVQPKKWAGARHPRRSPPRLHQLEWLAHGVVDRSLPWHRMLFFSFLCPRMPTPSLSRDSFSMTVASIFCFAAACLR